MTKLSRENIELSEKKAREDISEIQSFVAKEIQKFVILSNNIEGRGTKSKRLIGPANRVFKWYLERREITLNRE